MYGGAGVDRQRHQPVDNGDGAARSDRDHLRRSGIPLPVWRSASCRSVPIPFLVVGSARASAAVAGVQESLAAMTESAEEQFGGIRVTKTFAVEPIARPRFGETVDRIRDNQLGLVSSARMFQALLPCRAHVARHRDRLGRLLALQGTMTLGNFVAVNARISDDR